MTESADVAPVDWREDDFAFGYHFGWWYVGRQACCMELMPVEGSRAFSLWLLLPQRKEVAGILGDATTARAAALPTILEAYPHLKPRRPDGNA